MLVAVAGSQGSGKSTVLDAIDGLGINVIRRKTSRSILSDWGITLDEVNSDVELSLKFQLEILNRKLADEKEAVESTDLWFTERTFADLFVYTLVNIGKHNEHSDWLNQYADLCTMANTQYSHVFYLPAGVFPVVSDGVRSCNHHFSRMIDTVLQDWTTRSIAPANFTLVQSIGVEDRVNQILSIVTNKSR